jgi:hypothetical protein
VSGGLLARIATAVPGRGRSILRAAGAIGSYLWFAGTAAAALPDQAAGIRIGDRIGPEDARLAGGTPLNVVASDFDRLLRSCGYQVVRLTAPAVPAGVDLLVEIEDGTVTRLVHRQPLPAERSALEHAEALLATYGQPAGAALRDARGAVTIERNAAAFVILDYDSPSPVRFTVSGPPARTQTTTIAYEDRSWHQNKMIRCARAKDG